MTSDAETIAGDIPLDEQEEFTTRLTKARQIEESTPAPPALIDGKQVVWAPQPGSQVDFMSCPIFETMFHGTRGNGKSDALLMAFAQHIGHGHGADWRGIILRQTYPQLADIVAKSEKWFRRMFPRARFNRARLSWEFPGGEELLFRHMKRPEDYHSYHGHQYPFIGFEELTNWPIPDCYTRMFSCCRSSNPNVPRMIRSTTNPYGPGTTWIKERFRLHGQWWKTIVIDNATDPEGRIEPPRCAIHGHLDENRILLEADPFYKQSIVASATNAAMAAAWLEGSWDITAGGMFDDVWSQQHNCVPEFHVPVSWRIDRSFDWGSSRPFSVGWWAVSDGSDLRLRNGQVMSTVRGDLFRVREWYGWTGRANEGTKMLAVDVAKGIVERELMWGWRTGHGASETCRVRSGPADSAILTNENGVSISNDMQKIVRIGTNLHRGISWLAADKRPGSRKKGWEQMRKMIRNARPMAPGLPRESPGLFVIERECGQFLRTVLTLSRDEKDLDDIDTETEDHVADEVRYRVASMGTEMTSGTTVGMF